MCTIDLVVPVILFLLTGMNTLLVWECGEPRPERRRVEEKERKNDRRGEAHRTPPIYHPDSFRPLPRRERREREMRQMKTARLER